MTTHQATHILARGAPAAQERTSPKPSQQNSLLPLTQLILILGLSWAAPSNFKGIAVEFQLTAERQDISVLNSLLFLDLPVIPKYIQVFSQDFFLVFLRKPRYFWEAKIYIFSSGRPKCTYLVATSFLQLMYDA